MLVAFQYVNMVLQHLRRLYSLDTLDTRFTHSSTKPPNPCTSDKQIHLDFARPPLSGVGHRSTGGNGVQQGETYPGSLVSKWSTTEFMVYAVLVSAAVFMMVKNAYEISIRTASLQAVEMTLSNKH